MRRRPRLNPSSVSHVITDGAVLGVRWYMGGFY